MAGLERTADDLHVRDADLVQTLRGFGRENSIGFQSDDRRSKAGKHRRRVAAAAADIEDDVGRIDLGKLQEPGEWRGFHQVARRSLAGAFDGDVLVEIGKCALMRRHEKLARNGAHDVENAVIRHVFGTKLGVDHLRPRDGEIFHLR